MKQFPYIFALVASLFLFSLPAAHAHSARDTQSILKTLRAEYSSINHSLGHCAQVKRDLDGRSAEGGILVGYRSGQRFCKITAIYYRETGKVSEEYYLWHDKLFFMVQTDFIYRQPLGAHVYNTPDGVVAKTRQERFYVDKGKLICWLGENNSPLSVQGKAAQAKMRHLTADVNEYLAFLQAPDTKEAR